MTNTKENPTTPAFMQNIAVVLSRPKHAGNIGFTARCMKNMGLAHLIVIPRELPLALGEISGQATPFARDVVQGIEIHGTLEEALAPMQFVIGTTARKGSGRGPQVRPREAALAVVNRASHNRVALLFGPEDRGLTNEELRFCHLIVNIPTAGFSSINLSHAVMILCYEIFLAAAAGPDEFVPQMASVQETERMFAQMRDFLCHVGFLQKENPEYWLRHIRRFFARTNLLSREVKVVRGIMRHIEWKVNNNK